MGPLPAHADDLGAAISYTHYSTDFDFGTPAIENADVDELGLTIGESITPLFDLALQGGYSNVDLDDHPAADGYDLTGRFFGIVARTEPTLIPALLSLRIQAAYRWHDVDNGRLDHQYDELTWYETALRVGPVLSVGPVDIAAGGYYTHYDGEEEARGPLAFRRDFSAGSSGGAFASVALELGDGGLIGIYAQSGARQGYGITFSTGF
ncbi:MAG TPA: hypothetical protein VFH57_04540 [Gammaproteobacteria bacterium]|nr:hypothetical protein [Gammaproteobacteria bacterium]